MNENKECVYSRLPKFDKSRVGWPWTEETPVGKYDKTIFWPKISIVTPSFNQGRYVEETIRSVLMQNYPNLEYIIIDGGSTDDTVKILNKYSSYIAYWVSEPDRGQSHAINKGLEKCTGDIVNWLNSDDWLEPGSLFRIAKAFLNNPQVKVVSGYENHKGIDGTFSVSNGTYLKSKLEETIELCQVAQPSTFFRFEAFKQITPVPEDIHYIMDGELWVRFLLLFGQDCFYKIHKPLVNFRLHENSKTVNNGRVTNEFLIERSSIVTDLLHFIQVPEKIINFWENQVFNTPKTKHLKRKWKFNEGIISERKVRIHFIKMYINSQLTKQNFKEAWWGVNQLIGYSSYDVFLIKSLFKLILK